MRSILANERNNVKFNFLVPGDPYHAYYQHKVRCCACCHVGSVLTGLVAGRYVQGRRCRRRERTGGGTARSTSHAPSACLTSPARAQAAKGAAAGAEAAPERVAVQTATNFKPVILEAPEKVRRGRCVAPATVFSALTRLVQEQYTIALPDGIAAFDLDVIKLTAQFVARNGKSFLTGLTSREHMNPQARVAVALLGGCCCLTFGQKSHACVVCP